MSPDECREYRLIGTGSTVSCNILSHYNGVAHEMDYLPIDVFRKVRNSSSSSVVSERLGYDVVGYILNGMMLPEAEYFYADEFGPPMETLIRGNLLGWTEKLIDVGTELEDSQSIRFVTQYTGLVLGQLDRSGVCLESFTYGT